MFLRCPKAVLNLIRDEWMCQHLPKLGLQRAAFVNIVSAIQVYFVWILCYTIGRKVTLLFGFFFSFLIFVPLLYGNKYYLLCTIGQSLATMMLYHGQTKLEREPNETRKYVSLQLTLIKEILFFGDMTFKFSTIVLNEMEMSWITAWFPWILAYSFLFSQMSLLIVEVLKYSGSPPMASDEFSQNKITLPKITQLFNNEPILFPILNNILTGMSSSFMGIIYSRVLNKILPGGPMDVTDAEIAFGGTLVEVTAVIVNRFVKANQKTKDFIHVFSIFVHCFLILPVFWGRNLFSYAKSPILIFSVIVFKIKDALPNDNTMGTINSCHKDNKTTIFALYSSFSSLGKAAALLLLPHLTLTNIFICHLLVAILRQVVYYTGKMQGFGRKGVQIKASKSKSSSRSLVGENIRKLL